jgi:O-antigen/teichoic acid export membrane protein
MATAAPLDVSQRQELGSRVVRAFAWKGASRGLLEASKLAVGIVLARALTPSDYGIAGMVLVFSGLIPIFSGLALGSALVQRPSIDEEDRSTAFWAGLGFGIVLAGIGVALSWPIASFYGQPRVHPLLAVLSISFVLTSLGMTHSQLLVRTLSYRALELRAMGGTLVGAAVGIAAALAGYGPWALILQLLATTATSTALLWLLSPWRPRFLFSWTSLRRLARFGGNVSGALVLTEVNSNADNLLIGRFIGAFALGQYAVAYNVMLVPFSRITSPLQEVLYAAFSRIQDDIAYVRGVWLRVNRIVAGVTAPALAGLVLLTPDVVHVVIGDRWLPAVPVIRILACVGLIQALQGLNASVLMACDRSGTYLRFTIVSVCANLGAFALGLRWGISGVAACFAVSMIILQPFYTHLAAKAVGSSIAEFLANLRGVAVATALMAAAVAAVDFSLRHYELPTVVHLLGLTLLGVIIYVLALARFAPDVAHDARGVFRRLAPRPAPS